MYPTPNLKDTKTLKFNKKRDPPSHLPTRFKISREKIE